MYLRNGIMCAPGRGSDFDAHANLRRLAFLSTQYRYTIIMAGGRAGENERSIVGRGGGGHNTRTVAVPAVKLPRGGCCGAARTRVF